MTTISSLTLAVDVGGSHITVALVADDGLRARRDFEVKPERGLRPYLPRIEQAVSELFVEIPTAAEQCGGLGLALPLLVDPTAARVISAPRGKFEDAPQIDFRAWANERFRLPLKLEVDAHAGCLGEWVFGAGRGCEDMVFVTLGTGYGTSVILRGRPLRGRSGLAGILGGHLSVNVDGHKCVCPGRGCAEAETGTWTLDAVVREQPDYAASALAAHATVNYRTLFAAADSGDALARRIVQRNLGYWGASLVNLTHAYNPARIVMAGSILKAAERMIPFFNDYLHRQVWTVGDYPEVVVARHIDTAALFGCRALFTRELACL